MKKLNKFASLILLSIVTVVSYMTVVHAVDDRGRGHDITLTVENKTDFNVYIESLQGISLFGDVKNRSTDRSRPDFTPPLNAGNKGETSWNLWAPGIDELYWKAKSGTLSGNEPYHQTEVVLGFNKAKDPSKTSGTVQGKFVLSPTKVGQAQNITVTYEGKEYNFIVKVVSAIENVWELPDKYVRYYNYFVTIDKQ